MPNNPDYSTDTIRAKNDPDDAVISVRLAYRGTSYSPRQTAVEIEYDGDMRTILLDDDEVVELVMALLKERC